MVLIVFVIVGLVCKWVCNEIVVSVISCVIELMLLIVL